MHIKYWGTWDHSNWACEECMGLLLTKIRNKLIENVNWIIGLCCGIYPMRYYHLFVNKSATTKYNQKWYLKMQEEERKAERWKMNSEKERGNLKSQTTNIVLFCSLVLLVWGGGKDKWFFFSTEIVHLPPSFLPLLVILHNLVLFSHVNFKHSN